MRVSSWRPILLLSLAGASACTGALPAQAPRAGDRWVELGTPHFLIRTDLQLPRARNLAHTLEEMRAALLALAWPGAKDPRGRSDVIVFSRPADFDRFCGLHASTEGVAVSRSGFERLIAFNPGREGDVPRTAVHELSHDLSHWFLPLQPPWLAEGMAVYLDSTTLDRSAQRATMGDLSKSSVEWFKYARFFLRTSKLFHTQAMHPTDPRESASFYATSWLLVHFLLNRHGEEFAEFQKRVMRLTPWEEGFAQAFPALTYDALDVQLTEYVKAGTFRTITEPVQLPVFEPALRVLPEAEVRGVRALLSSSLQNPLSEAEAAEALRLDSGEIHALVVRFHALSPSATQARTELAERALAAHPRNVLAWWLRALALPPGDEQRRALDRAQQLGPDHPGVAQLLGMDELRQGHPKQALEHVRLALRRSPVTPITLALYVSALGAARQCADAAALAASAPGILPADCSMTLDDQPLDCARYVQLAYARIQPACQG
jgi:hypothetical protein